MKRDQYNYRRNSIKQKKDQEEKGKQNNQQSQQRGGTINFQPKVDKTEKVPMDSKREKNFDEEEEDEFRDDRIATRRKKTLHEPKMMEVIEEEKFENEEPFDREFKIETPQKKRYDFKTSEKFGKGNTYSDNLNKSKNPRPIPNLSNSKVETKYLGDKKVTTTTTTKTEQGKDGQKKTVTTTITEEVGGGRNPNLEPRFRNKVVKDIPFKSYGRRQYQNPKDEFDIEKEMKELEKDFDAEFGHLNLKSPIKPVFEPTDDMFDKEDDIDMPEGAVSIEVKQKIITDSKGKPVLIVHKTIHYANGEKKTIIEKKNLVKK